MELCNRTGMEKRERKAWSGVELVNIVYPHRTDHAFREKVMVICPVNG